MATLRRSLLSLVAALLAAGGASAQTRPAAMTGTPAPLVLPGDNGSTWQHKWFVTNDGARLHYIEAGNSAAPTMVLVPGWTMPAAIWAPQITYFAKDYHVIAFDPRGQGDSQITATGYDHARRTDDLAELLGQLDQRPVVLVGWSLGVLEALSYVGKYGDARVQGLVLVDNSIGEGPDPVPPKPAPAAANGPAVKAPAKPVIKRPLRQKVSVCGRGFVKSMYAAPRTAEYLDALAASCSRLPPAASSALLRFDVHRSHWRAALYSTPKPILYLITPRWKMQADFLTARHPAARSVVFADSGHAIFVDKARQFNKEVCDFVIQLGWDPVCKDGSE